MSTYRVRAGSLGDFEASMDAFVDLVGKRATLLVQGVTQAVFNEIQSGGRYSEGTPVADPKYWKKPVKGYVGGFHRANWQGGINELPTQGAAELQPGQPGMKAQVAKSEAARDLLAKQVQPGDTAFFMNDGPAIWPLEFGWSSQAPVGMIRETLRNLQPLVDEVGAHVRERT